MSHELKEGVVIRVAYFDNGESYTVGGAVIRMTIAEQCGQMSMVPWIKVEMQNRPDIFINCASLSQIELAE